MSLSDLYLRQQRDGAHHLVVRILLALLSLHQSKVTTIALAIISTLRHEARELPLHPEHLVRPKRCIGSDLSEIALGGVLTREEILDDPWTTRPREIGLRLRPCLLSESIRKTARGVRGGSILTLLSLDLPKESLLHRVVLGNAPVEPVPFLHLTIGLSLLEETARECPNSGSWGSANHTSKGREGRTKYICKSHQRMFFNSFSSATSILSPVVL